MVFLVLLTVLFGPQLARDLRVLIFSQKKCGAFISRFVNPRWRSFFAERTMGSMEGSCSSTRISRNFPPGTSDTRDVVFISFLAVLIEMKESIHLYSSIVEAC